VLTILASLDLVEFRQRLFKFVLEEPHRVKNLTRGWRLSYGPTFWWKVYTTVRLPPVD
jgi:hypothetical protein